jgi:transcriptional regulator with XRE-family HTH domain
MSSKESWGKMPVETHISRAAEVRYLRHCSGLTIEEFGRICGVSKTLIFKIEHEQVYRPAPPFDERLQDFAELLGELEEKFEKPEQIRLRLITSWHALGNRRAIDLLADGRFREVTEAVETL